MDRNPSLAPLAEAFLRHLRLEEDRLRAARDALADLYDAARRGDLDRVRSGQPARDAAAAALGALPAARAAVAAPLAAALGLPAEAVTLSAVAARLPAPWVEQVAAARDRLRALAAEAADLQRRNAILVHHLRSFFGGVLAGDDAPPPRYGPSGDRLGPAAAAVISARG